MAVVRTNANLTDEGRGENDPRHGVSNTKGRM